MKAKRLTLKEMWELYKLLGKSQNQTYLLSEIVEMLKNVPPQNIKKSMLMLYKDMPSNPIELGILFTRGLQENKFFEFQSMLEKLS